MHVNTRSEFVAQELSINLCDSYARFLNCYGDYDSGGKEVYGYTENYEDINLLPCVIGATKLFRDDYNLKPEDIVLAHTGYEDHIIILDNKRDNVWEVNVRGDRVLLSTSFDDWFQKYINE